MAIERGKRLTAEWKVDMTRDNAPVIYVDGPMPNSSTVLFQSDWANEPEARLVVTAVNEREPLLAALRGAVEALKTARDYVQEMYEEDLLDPIGTPLHENGALGVKTEADAAILAAEEFLK